MSRSTTDNTKLGRLLYELSQLLAEEDLSRRNSDMRHATMKEKFLEFRALVKLGLSEDEAGTSEIVTATGGGRIHDGASEGDTPGEWMTLAEAGRLADAHRGTISRAADAEKIEDNLQKGHKRRVEKSSVLYWMGKKQEEKRKREFEDYGKILDNIPDKH